ncbi:MAG TPA: hypothetical protein VMY77_04965 [Chitinophagaceae bacterium]|nr:hypothetical protein [Chitinophagaceae bacterium]
MLAIVLVLISIISWEFYLRSKHYPISYNDDESLWSTKRKEVYKPTNDETIFIGSSRIKFDLDIPTWEKLTGEKPIQLSFVGTSPRPLLDDLAKDKNFKGKVILDVTEGLFFGRNTKRTEKSAIDGIEYYKKWTPAEKFSFYVNYILESGFVFLDKNKFSLNALLDDLPFPKRKGIVERSIFPRAFGMNTSDRQSFMSQIFLNDTLLQEKQKKNWAINGNLNKSPGVQGDSLLAIFKQVKFSIDKIKARGGQVLFVRTPSSGAYLDAEKINFPRQKYWDSLLLFTNCHGIYFEDYPETAHFVCPEWSHLTSTDAVIYTKALINILEKEQGWVFPHKKTFL